MIPDLRPGPRPGLLPAHTLPERWQSGRMHRLAKAAWGRPQRGFESLPLRHITFPLRGEGYKPWEGP